jgi:hypothetical protein
MAEERQRTAQKRRQNGSEPAAQTRPQAEVVSHGTPAGARDADESERALGRAVAIGLPIVCVVAAVVVGALAGAGSALLVLASGALLAAIALLWASVRTLSGDAPLPGGLEAVATPQGGVDDLVERKLRVLRALKDLESEHALGKIDDADYQAFVEKYRAEAKAVMREMDTEMAPLLEQAERLAREYLAKQGSGGVEESPTEAKRVECRSCHASNENDAAFCKQCGASIKGSAAAEKSDAAT